MIKNRKTFFLAIFIILLPHLGFTSTWKTILVILSGVLLAIMSVRFSIPKKVSKPRSKKESIIVENVEVSMNQSPGSPQDQTVETPSK